MWYFLFFLTIVITVLSIKISNITEKLNSVEKQLEKRLDKHSRMISDIISEVDSIKNSNLSNSKSDEDVKPKEVLEPIAQKQETLASDFTFELNEQETKNPQENEQIDILSDEEAKEKLNENAFKKDEDFDFEKAFLGNIFNKIGAIAILIGVGIFVKIISSFIVFTPELKITLSYLASIIIFGFGCTMKEAKMQAYKEVMLGLGVSISFITTYCASFLLKVFDPAVSLIIATILLLIVYVIANKQKTNSMITIALFGGYLNPFLITHNINSELLFGYYIVVNLLSCIYVFKNPNKSVINFINLLLTYVVLGCFIGIRGEHVKIVYPLILWALYLIYDIIRKNKSNNDNDPVNILNWLNFVILTLFTFNSFWEEKTYISYLLIAVGIIYFILVYINVAAKSENYKPYMYSLFICIFLSTFFISEGILRISLWSLESVFLSLISHKFALKNVSHWAIAFLFAAICNIFAVNGAIYQNDMSNYIPVINTRFYAFLAPILSSGISYYIFKKESKEPVNTIAQNFRLLFWSLIYLFASFEINNIIENIL